MKTKNGRQTIRLAAAALVAAGAIGLAACGSDDSDATASTSSTDTVSVQSIGDTGDVLVDSKGTALYSPDQEAQGKILCTGEC